MNHAPEMLLEDSDNLLDQDELASLPKPNDEAPEPVSLVEPTKEIVEIDVPAEPEAIDKIEEFYQYMNQVTPGGVYDVTWSRFFENPLVNPLSPEGEQYLQSLQQNQPVVVDGNSSSSSFWGMLNPIGSAYANPLVVGPAATGAFGMAAPVFTPIGQAASEQPVHFDLRSNYDENGQWTRPTYPRPIDSGLSGLGQPYEGRDPSLRDIDHDLPAFPIHQDSNFRTETPIDQPGDRLELLTFPIIYLSLYHLYSNKKSFDEKFDDVKLPTVGEYPYTLPKGIKSNGQLPKVNLARNRVGYRDDYGNVWVKGPVTSTAQMLLLSGMYN